MITPHYFAYFAIFVGQYSFTLISAPMSSSTNCRIFRAQAARAFSEVLRWKSTPRRWNSTCGSAVCSWALRLQHGKLQDYHRMCPKDLSENMGPPNGLSDCPSYILMPHIEVVPFKQTHIDHFSEFLEFRIISQY